MSTMYLGHYAFDGDPAVLAAAYRRLSAMFPPGSLDLQVAVTRRDGLDIFDACPDAGTFRSFSTSDRLRSALDAAGLPPPRISELGEVVGATLKHPVG